MQTHQGRTHHRLQQTSQQQASLVATVEELQGLNGVMEQSREPLLPSGKEPLLYSSREPLLPSLEEVPIYICRLVLVGSQRCTCTLYLSIAIQNSHCSFT